MNSIQEGTKKHGGNGRGVGSSIIEWMRNRKSAEKVGSGSVSDKIGGTRKLDAAGKGSYAVSGDISHTPGYYSLSEIRRTQLEMEKAKWYLRCGVR